NNVTDDWAEASPQTARAANAVRVFFIQGSPVSGLMRPFGIDRLYAWFRPNREEFGGSVLCRIECCARTSHRARIALQADPEVLQISPNSPEKIHA
ncbi:hypothetical protein, partial [Variovorax sp. Root411]|uniref:hypothetical protein n=1 Tax=Variovorax sp. Root411 TaxID=1736530 RepID=UPI00138F0FF4